MWFLVLSLIFVFVSGENDHNTPRKGQEEHSKNSRIESDSYLDAYTESHGENIDSNIVNTDREMSFPTGFQGGFPDEHFGVQYPYPAPSHQHGPPHPPAYGPPRPSYGPPQPAYGPPQPPYGQPQPAYGPPQPSYGASQPSYGPPPFPNHNYGPPAPPFYGVPHGMLGILDKLKLKFDLITIFKILLKIILFKKLVSFIAIICLLLFIPWLKAKKALHHHHHGGGGGHGGGDEHDEEEEDDLMMRQIDGQSSQGNDRLNNITVYVLEAIENFGKYDSSDQKCDNVYCTVNKIAKKISDKVTYEKDLNYLR